MGMSPCVEGMSLYFAQFRKFPLSKQGSKWLSCETSVFMSALSEFFWTNNRRETEIYILCG